MLKLLIADDETDTSNAIRRTIPWIDYDILLCSEATNGKEAIEIIEAEHPDIALLDVRMPLLDGLGVVKYIPVSYTHLALVTPPCLICQCLHFHFTALRGLLTAHLRVLHHPHFASGKTDKVQAVPSGLHFQHSSQTHQLIILMRHNRNNIHHILLFSILSHFPP